ncbi:MAG TPA: hypothetical protein VH142_00350, partial [Polyangiaceae bacterium]|nr:hypothetical protein [Polyangiaceae bacterium]
SKQSKNVASTTVVGIPPTHARYVVGPDTAIIGVYGILVPGQEVTERDLTPRDLTEYVARCLVIDGGTPDPETPTAA